MPELQVVCLPPGRCLGQYEAEKASDGVWGSYLLCGRLFSVPYAGPSAARSCQTPEWWELSQGESPGLCSLLQVQVTWVQGSYVSIV